MNSNYSNAKVQKYLPSLKTFLAIILLFFIAGIGSMIALANENTVVVMANVLNVRLGPGLSYDILTQVNQDDRLQILSEENQWYQVRIGNDQLGWVASWLVEKEEITPDSIQYGRVINAPEVNLRQYASAESEIIGTIPENAELEIVYQDGDWYQVLYMGKVAWINSDYLEIIAAPTQLEASLERIIDYESYVSIDAEAAEIYMEPTSNSSVIYHATYGEEFNYLYSEGDWFYVEVAPDQYGYIGNWLASAHTNDFSEEVEVSQEENRKNYHARVNTHLSEATIVIDAGHGGTDPGAISTDEQVYEKELALNTSFKLQARLQDAGANVIMTRTEDRDVGLGERAQISNQNHADLFISLHFDSLEVPNMMSGTTTYYYNDADLDIAETISHYLATQGELPNNGTRFGNFQVLRENTQPAILIELGYMNHFVDLKHIRTDHYQATVAEAIYQALRDYYGQ
ncbi:N-acetylmuramoyl-L-alanine amidase [Allofustis seminis]|uniref:N-acetylmuramoyl-L-alanine amidase n=1 Tax=Allofustis seminis TaxID=166939 RepID=UPI0003743AB1|nr:N-acetylmuramoyl-L-alanine amidase [Allofustis seminis]